MVQDQVLLLVCSDACKSRVLRLRTACKHVRLVFLWMPLLVFAGIKFKSLQKSCVIGIETTSGDVGCPGHTDIQVGSSGTLPLAVPPRVPSSQEVVGLDLLRSNCLADASQDGSEAVFQLEADAPVQVGCDLNLPINGNVPVPVAVAGGARSSGHIAGHDPDIRAVGVVTPASTSFPALRTGPDDIFRQARARLCSAIMEGASVLC